MEGPVVEGMQYSDWQRLYQDALVEIDETKLAERVAAAEGAMLSRLGTIGAGEDSLTERQAIADALAILRVLKKEGGSKVGNSNNNVANVPACGDGHSPRQNESDVRRRERGDRFRV